MIRKVLHLLSLSHLVSHLLSHLLRHLLRHLRKMGKLKKISQLSQSWMRVMRVTGKLILIVMLQMKHVWQALVVSTTKPAMAW